MSKNNLVSEVPGEEETYPLIYNNIWNVQGNVVFNVGEGGTLIMQTGRPTDPGKPPGT